VRGHRDLRDPGERGKGGGGGAGDPLEFQSVYKEKMTYCIQMLSLFLSPAGPGGAQGAWGWADRVTYGSKSSCSLYPFIITP
jgi:hypothetical protein